MRDRIPSIPSYGNFMMATGVLRAFSVPEAELSAIVKSWKDAPGSKSVRLDVSMSISEYDAIRAKEGKSPEAILNALLEEKKKELIEKAEK